MKPDEKYMTNKSTTTKGTTKSTTTNGDLNLVPFKGGGNPFNMTQAGWIPVYFFGNPGFDNNIASSMGLPSPMSSNMMQPNMNTQNMQGFNKMNKNPNSMQNTNTSQGSNNMQDFNNPNTFPDEDNAENLYSYNTSTNSNPNLNTSNDRNTPSILNILRDLNIDLDEDNDLIRHCSDKRIDKIYDKIEKYNPEVMKVLETYEMPCPIAKVLIRKIIKLTLNHCKRDGD